MGRRILVISGSLIALYLVIANATDGGKLLVAGGRDFAVPIIKAFQGR